jgi:hypothetical protein
MLYRYLNFSQLVSYPKRVSVSYKALPTFDDMAKYFGKQRGDAYAVEREACDRIKYADTLASKNSTWLEWAVRKALGSFEPHQVQQMRSHCYRMAYSLRYEVFSNKTRQYNAERARQQRSADIVDPRNAKPGGAALNVAASLFNPLLSILGATDPTNNGQNTRSGGGQGKDASADPTEALYMPKLRAVRHVQLPDSYELSCIMKCMALNRAMLIRRQDYADHYIYNVPDSVDPRAARAYLGMGGAQTPARPKKLQYVRLG